MTGATGFLGRYAALALAARGFRVRVLARGDTAHPLWQHFTPDVVHGSLEDDTALQTLVTGASTVVHAAGLVLARNRREFLSVNRDGARRVAAATQRHAPQARLVGISSLAAREPQLSPYADSKAAGEAALRDAFSGSIAIVRPPAIYGPWDHAMLGIFRAAARRIILVPGKPDARIALIHVADAAAAIAAVAETPEPPALCTLADVNPAGYTPRDIMTLAAESLGNTAMAVHLPPFAIRLAGHAAGMLARLTGRPAIFGPGKAHEMLHTDWSVSPAELLPAAIAAPAIDLRQGFAETAAWYRQAGWLAPGAASG